MTYTGARRLLLVGGLAVLAVIALVQYLRGVEPVEIGTTLLFIPVVVAFVYWRIPGGLIAGALATIGYVALRYPAVEAVGAGPFTGIVLSRGIGFLLFGALGGWANSQLEGSLAKLDLYDQIDDATGLFNARFFVQDTDLEMSRAQRYQTLFSVAAVDVPARSIQSLDRRKRARLLRELGRQLKDAGRVVDRPAHGFDGDRHLLAFVLPETGAEGVHIFVERLADKVVQVISQHGASVDRNELRLRTATFPGDDDALQGVRNEFSEIDRFEHPQVAAGPAATSSST